MKEENYLLFKVQSAFFLSIFSYSSIESVINVDFKAFLGTSRAFHVDRTTMLF